MDLNLGKQTSNAAVTVSNVFSNLSSCLRHSERSKSQIKELNSTNACPIPKYPNCKFPWVCGCLICQVPGPLSVWSVKCSAEKYPNVGVSEQIVTMEQFLSIKPISQCLHFQQQDRYSCNLLLHNKSFPSKKHHVASNILQSFTDTM